MNLNELDQYLELINSLLIKSAVKINKWREKFMLEVLLLYLIIPGRINFLQLGRYGRFGEQRYRQQFGRRFDWLSFNASLAESQIGNRVAIAFDPSYISKSGKCTPYMGRFWSGCAKMAKRGLEISGIGLIDMDLHTCFHLEAVQTPPTKTLEQVKYTLIDWYLHVLRTRKEKLLRLTNYVVADAYFSKSTFVDGALEMGFHVISRFRDDAYFRYLTAEQSTGKRGRPKLYDGKIEIKHLEEDRFEIINLENGQGRILSAVVHSRSLSRDILLCIWESEDKKVHKLYFSTDIQMKAIDVLDFCREQGIQENRFYYWIKKLKSQTVSALEAPREFIPISPATVNSLTRTSSIESAKEKTSLFKAQDLKITYPNGVILQMDSGGCDLEILKQLITLTP